MFILDSTLQKIVTDFSKLEEVEGILLAGSQASATQDENSDIDLYLYVDKGVPIAKRKEITGKYSDYMEINNQFWETEDDGILTSCQIGVELIYRSYSWMKGELEKVLVRHIASVGYSTCLWYNYSTSKILYDRDKRLELLQKKFDVKYPLALKHNIIQKNYPILRKILGSYYYQIKKAIIRKDLVSVNHRIAGLLASYFDVLFAINEMPHPGEKKMLQIAKSSCSLLPENMGRNINMIIHQVSHANINVLEEIDNLIDRLDQLLVKENIGI